ncbi:hypothetical protein TSAR_011884 [Trichomalopsis sarcophagae]|uniref:C2H2-type domain-containing protein n=1 Tax=Trichomalopsis sarcophagae TaxID=543379 RepID=A0A232ERE4_9HYME|nr:hypothetical protein TSAR_011884 [Trichomalopsis sarcophagae]
MGSYKDYQENVNPLQDIMNHQHRSPLKELASSRTILSVPKSPGTPSKSKVNNIQYFDNNAFSSTSNFELEKAKRLEALISNKFAKRPVTGGIPPKFEHISKLNRSSNIAAVASQREKAHEEASPPKRQRLEETDDTDDVCIIEEKINRPRESTVNNDREHTVQGTQSRNNIQVTSTITKQSIPANLTIDTTPKVPPKVANAGKSTSNIASRSILVNNDREHTVQGTQSRNNIQVTSTITKQSIPANLTIDTTPKVPQKVANAARRSEREQQSNGTNNFASNSTHNNDKEFFDSLRLDNITSRKHKLRELESKYRKNVNGISVSEDMQILKKQINMLIQGIEQSEKIRLDIAESKSIIISEKYTCKKCMKGYEKRGNIINHILDLHPEIIEEYKPAEINDAASTVINDRDETSSLSSHSHSINSQITLMDSNVAPYRTSSAASQSHSVHSQVTLLNNNEATHRGLSSASSTTSQHSIHSQNTVLNNNIPPHRELNAEFNIRKDNNNLVLNQADPVGQNIPVSRGRNEIVNASTQSTKPIPVKSNDSRVPLQTAGKFNSMGKAPTEFLPTDTTNAHLQTTVVEIEQDNPVWKRIDINFVPRKLVDFLGHESFELFEKHERMIRNWMKKLRSNSSATSTTKPTKSASPQKPKRNNLTLYDGSAQVNKYKLDLLYNKAELEQINHCYTNNKIDELCKSCVYKLVEFQAKQYAVSTAAYNEHERISKDRRLSNQEKKRKIKELVSTRDEYSFIRERLNKVNTGSSRFKQNTFVINYNRTYFLLLQKAFNDMKIRDFVQLDQPNLAQYNFGIYCSKLMDDIVNEFLVQVTVICMNFAYQKRQVTLTKELLSQYQVFFKMTNKDATYLEPCAPDVQNFFKKNYSKCLPNIDVLEILIIDCLLRRCFSDENTMHEGLDELIFEHLKSPQPIFKFLMYMKFTERYLEIIRELLLKFLFQLSVEVLKLKKEKNSTTLVTFEELIEACEIVGVFGSSYIHYLKKAYKQYFKETIGKSCNNIISKNYVVNSDGLLTQKRTIK